MPNLTIAGYTIPIKHIEKSFAHSSGKGGQHVNKTNSKVTLRLNIDSLHELPEDVRQLLQSKTGINHIIATSEKTRHQHLNLELAIKSLQHKIDMALHEDPERIATKPTYRTRVGKWIAKHKARLRKWKESRFKGDN